jgi:hypothetical protein
MPKQYISVLDRPLFTLNKGQPSWREQPENVTAPELCQTKPRDEAGHTVKVKLGRRWRSSRWNPRQCSSCQVDRLYVAWVYTDPKTGEPSWCYRGKCPECGHETRTQFFGWRPARPKSTKREHGYTRNYRARHDG